MLENWFELIWKIMNIIVNSNHYFHEYISSQLFEILILILFPFIYISSHVLQRNMICVLFLSYSKLNYFLMGKTVLQSEKKGTVKSLQYPYLQMHVKNWLYVWWYNMIYLAWDIFHCVNKLLVNKLVVLRRLLCLPQKRLFIYRFWLRFHSFNEHYVHIEP